MIGLFLITKLRGKLQPVGAIWMVYITWYSFGRFGIQYLRLDDVKFWGFQEAHIIAILVLAFSVPYLIMKVRWSDGKVGTGGDLDTDGRSTAQRKRDRQRKRAQV